MTQTRKAEGRYLPAIFKILEELDLKHPDLEREFFWVALEGGRVVGVSNLHDCGKSFYLSAVGVSEKFQGKGFGKILIGTILDNAKKDVYVYTKIPAFFEKLGFVKSEPSKEIPPREIYDCRSCGGGADCICMMRPYNAE